MKIGLLCEVHPPIQDGVSQVVVNTGRLLQEHGNEVTVFTAKVPGYHYDTNYQVKNIPSLPLVFKLPYRAEVPAWMILPNASIYKQPFDIVHAHSPFTSGHLASRMARRKHIPFVITFHTKFRDDFAHVISSNRILDYIVRRVMRIYNEADEVWVPQASVLDVMREYGYKGHAEIVPNATDYFIDPLTVTATKQAHKQAFIQQLRAEGKLTSPTDPLILLFVGQIIWEKNIRFILEGLAHLPKELNYHAYFVGKGYALNEFRDLVAKQGLSDKITIVGQLDSRNEIEKYYYAADLFLFPSLYDNMPLVVLEAAAHHTPAILMDKSTSAGLITGTGNQANGFLTQNNVHDFARLIQEVVSNQNHLHIIGDNAARSIGRTWQDVVPEIEDRYRALIKRKQH